MYYQRLIWHGNHLVSDTTPIAVHQVFSQITKMDSLDNQYPSSDELLKSSNVYHYIVVIELHAHCREGQESWGWMEACGTVSQDMDGINADSLAVTLCMWSLLGSPKASSSGLSSSLVPTALSPWIVCAAVGKLGRGQSTYFIIISVKSPIQTFEITYPKKHIGILCI